MSTQAAASTQLCQRGQPISCPCVGQVRLLLGQKWCGRGLQNMLCNLCKEVTGICEKSFNVPLQEIFWQHQTWRRTLRVIITCHKQTFKSSWILCLFESKVNWRIPDIPYHSCKPPSPPNSLFSRQSQTPHFTLFTLSSGSLGAKFGVHGSF